jgi:hypothetical protein
VVIDRDREQVRRSGGEAIGIAGERVSVGERQAQDAEREIDPTPRDREWQRDEVGTAGHLAIPRRDVQWVVLGDSRVRERLAGVGIEARRRDQHELRAIRILDEHRTTRRARPGDRSLEDRGQGRVQVFAACERPRRGGQERERIGGRRPAGFGHRWHLRLRRVRVRPARER